MAINKELPERNHPRLKGYDYSKHGLLRKTYLNTHIKEFCGFIIGAELIEMWF